MDAAAPVDQMRFTIPCGSGLIAKSAAWQDYCETERPLGPALKRLNKVKAA
jgi:bifunctional non-homologous end joining protein LigD